MEQHAIYAGRTGPFADPAAVNPTLDRVAILVTITNRSGDDLNVNPGDFVARDAEHHVYAANPAATVTDAGLVSGQAAQRGTLPLPTVTLRGDDTISGFVVFDMPSGKQPVELVWRQSDTDTVAHLLRTDLIQHAPWLPLLRLADYQNATDTSSR